jgi:hypothetical protein
MCVCGVCVVRSVGVGVGGWGWGWGGWIGGGIAKCAGWEVGLDGNTGEGLMVWGWGRVWG